MAGRTIAIGDIHGCSKALAAVLAAVSPDTDDTVVLLGDYIDRGPDSRGVLDQLMTLRGRCNLVTLLGNHEQMLCTAFFNVEALNGWLTCGGREALASYGVPAKRLIRPATLVKLFPREHLEFLAETISYYETATHFFVHAGYRPELPMAQQADEVLRWDSLSVRTITAHCSGKAVIVGHTPQISGEILDLGFLKCIDTFCHGGKWLTALDVVTGRTWQADVLGRLRDTGPSQSRAARETVAPR